MRRRRPLPPIAILLTGLLLLATLSCSLDSDKRGVAAAKEQAGSAATASAQDDSYAKPAVFVANPFCRACHADFDGERLVRVHESAGIGCERCHGESLRHRSDEANVTPPELMYPKERINPTCMMCHPRHTINHVQDHQPILQAGLSIFEEAPPDTDAKKYCTDCHGRRHRMQHRATRWNKATGELIR